MTLLVFTLLRLTVWLVALAFCRRNQCKLAPHQASLLAHVPHSRPCQGCLLGLPPLPAVFFFFFFSHAMEKSKVLSFTVLFLSQSEQTLPQTLFFHSLMPC